MAGVGSMIGENAKKIHDITQILSNIESLQKSQKLLADAQERFNERLSRIEADIAILRESTSTKIDSVKEILNSKNETTLAEAKAKAIEASHAVVLAVQDGFNKRMQDIAINVDRLRSTIENPHSRIDSTAIHKPELALHHQRED
jgi:hypothetical protein